ncbi:hypothetical protein GGI17_004723 [Coemansia sp. S146]|nr:hypothetical protein GGI17_004723 [Coemansia sp. S146]
MISGDTLESLDEVAIPHSLTRGAIAKGGVHSPLTLRIAFEVKIMKNFLRVFAEPKQTALKALGNGRLIVADVTESDARTATPASAVPATKRKMDSGAYDGPSKRMQPKAIRSAPEA